MKRSRSIPRSIGKGLAYLQDTIDIGLSWVFHRLKRVNITERGKSPAEKKVKRVANRVFRFFGELGDSFYKEYEKLKRNRSDED